MRRKMNKKGQIIGVLAVISVALIIFVFTVVALLKNETKWAVKSQKSITALHICDAALDRVIWKLQLSNNWANATSLTGYTWTDVHSDISGGTYKLKIEAGDTIVTPGDTDNERTVTIEATATVTSELRTIKAVINRKPFNYSMITGGTAAVGGNAEIFWSDAICYKTGAASIVLGSGITLGADRTKYYSLGTIKYGSDFYPPNTSSYLFPNQTVPPLPAKPVIDANWFKNQAKLTNTYFGSGVGHTFASNNCVSPPGSGTHTTGGIHYPPTNECIIKAVDLAGRSDSLVVFVDTTDGNDYTSATAYNGNGDSTNPGADNWITFSGNSTQGSLIIMGPVYYNGNGGTTLVKTPPTNGYYPQTPNPYTLNNVTHNGFLYCAGNFKANGTPVFYGTIMVDPGSVLDSGNMKLYWREDLSSDGIIGKTVKIKRWKELPL